MVGTAEKLRNESFKSIQDKYMLRRRLGILPEWNRVEHFS